MSFSAPETRSDVAWPPALTISDYALMTIVTTILWRAQSA